MGKIKKWYRSVPIWLAIFLYAAAALVGASYLSNRVTGAAYYDLTGITVAYILHSPAPEVTAEGDTAYSYDSYDGSVSAVTGRIVPGEGGVTTWVSSPAKMSQEDAQRYEALQTLTRYSPFAIYSCLLLAAALIFYFTKLKQPLSLLETAYAKIAENELDFSLDYSGRDEMAQLCAAFEKMRQALDENNRRMLNLLDERRQLNDAYTHDLRTPIAVLKGYTEMLIKYLPTGRMSQEEVLDTIRTMSSHVARLEEFVGSMNTAQRIADLTLTRSPLPAGDFVSALRETAEILCGAGDLQCVISSSLGDGTLNIDRAAVTEVVENLLSNAIRFARSAVTVDLWRRDGTLSVTVLDDGPGFTKKELLVAAKPYYCGRQDGETYHLGLGLHICRTLCEKHGGRLVIANSPEGGAAVTAEFAI